MPAGHQPQHLDLPLGQAVEPGSTRGVGRRPPGDLLDQQARDLRREQGVAPGDDLDRGDELLGRARPSSRKPLAPARSAAYT